MPGKCGMRPDHSRRSVPVLMPLHSTATTMSSSPGGVSVEPAEHQVLGGLQQDGDGVQRGPPMSSVVCQRRVTSKTVKQI